MKKTIREHLNDLPEPYRTEALENAKNSKPNTEDAIVESKIEAIESAFIFIATPQGINYWNNFCDTL